MTDSGAPVKEDGDREVIRQWLLVAPDEAIDFIMRLHQENLDGGILEKIHNWYNEMYMEWGKLKERYDNESSG